MIYIYISRIEKDNDNIQREKERIQKEERK